MITALVIWALLILRWAGLCARDLDHRPVRPTMSGALSTRGSVSWLAENCPRLAHARTAQRRIVEARALREARKRKQLAELERAHRELQYWRAVAGGKRGYVAERHRKLKVAERALANVRSDLASLPTWIPNERQAA